MNQGTNCHIWKSTEGGRYLKLLHETTGPKVGQNQILVGLYNDELQLG